jgi:hypothetical protein
MMYSIIRFLLAASIFFSVNTMKMFSQKDCYSVPSIKFGNSEIENVDSAQFVFGVKNMCLELMMDVTKVCDGGVPVEVNILSVKSPSSSFSIGFFESKTQKTIVEVEVLVDGEVYYGDGENNVDVQTTIAEMSNPDIPFDRSSFSSALKKGLQKCFDQIKW